MPTDFFLTAATANGPNPQLRYARTVKPSEKKIKKHHQRYGGGGCYR
jgi:hypothetical protein